MKNRVEQVDISHFPIVDGELHIDSIALSRLAQRVGQTPFYAYSRTIIDQQIAALRQALPPIQLHFAIKANPMPAVIQHLAGIVDGFDLASAGELKIALDTPVSPENISFAGPGKTDQELTQAIAAGVTINAESENEINRIHQIAEKIGVTPSVAIRVNPDFELKSSGMKMGGGAKPFGIDAERVPETLKKLASLDIRFHGFHIYAGSQNLNTDAIIDSQQKTFELALRLQNDAPATPKLINIGGGFGIPYFPGDKEIELDRIGNNLSSLVQHFETVLPTTKIAMELGRFIVGPAGIYVCRITDIKQSRGELFAVVDGGLHHHLAASGNFGQVIRKNFPVAIATKMNHAKVGKANIVGPLCTPLDILANQVELPQVDIGDLVVVFQSGAYGASASPTDFLSHPNFVEVLV